MRHTARSANKVNNDPTHPSHWDYRLQCNTYTNLIWITKQKHWTEWLEETNQSSIWSINWLILGPSTEGGHTGIPPLTTTSSNGLAQQVTDNNQKSILLFKSLFPSQGALLQQDPTERYYFWMWTHIRQLDPTGNIKNEPIWGHRAKSSL